MDKNPCSKCSSADANVYRSDDVLHGEFGSTKFDTTWLAILDEAEFDGVDVLCDDCVSAYVEKDQLFPFFSSLAEIGDGPFPAKVYSILFTLEVHAIMKPLNEIEAGPERIANDDDMEYIEMLRRNLHFDPSGPLDGFPNQKSFIKETKTAAMAHVLAAFSLGARPDEDHIKKAAERYGARVEENVSSGMELVDEMLSEINSLTS